MAVSLRIIKLTREIDEGNYQAYEQLKALARTDPDAKRVLKTVKEPKKPVMREIKVSQVKKPDTPEQTSEKAKVGDATAIAQLRKKAEYEDIKAQNALGIALMQSDPAEARKWLTRSAKMPESMDALRRMAAQGDEEARSFIESRKDEGAVPRSKSRVDSQGPVRDDLGYIRPPVKHNRCRIGDVYRINDAKLQTGMKNTTVLIKEMKGDFVTVWTVTREPGKHKCAKLIEPSLAGFASPHVYVLTDATKVYRKDSLMEYKGSLGRKDIEQFRLSA